MAFIHRVIRSIACSSIALSCAGPISAWAQQSVVATVGTETVTVQDLEARTAAKLTSEQGEYELHLRQLTLNHERGRQEYKEHELGDLVDQRVLALEAQSRKSTAETLMAAVKPPAVTDAQLVSFYDAQKSQLNQPYSEVASKIKEYLEKTAAAAARRNYLDSLRSKYQATISLEPLREAVAAAGPMRGPENAPVTIVEFSDFQCPFCGRYEPIVEHVLAKYPTQVRLVYRNFPLVSLHPDAQKAAEAAMCAQEQGKFWQMHDLLFAEQTSLSVDALKEKAQRLGLDAKMFKDCFDSGRSRDAIAVDTQAADQLAITGTPTSFVNGRYVNGAITEADLTRIIESELHRVVQVAHR